MNNALPTFWAVVPAAGRGLRMAASVPKQYLPLAGRTVLEHSLSCLLDHPQLKRLIIALAADDKHWERLPCATDKRIVRITGGNERADSVLAALRHLEILGAQAEDWVLVHDAARPNLASSDLDLLLQALAADPVGGLLAMRARDTLKQAGDDGRVEKTLARVHIWHALTPQMFRFAALKRALGEALAAKAVITDEASAMEWAGERPRLIEGRSDNLKITRKEDLPMICIT